MSRGRKYALNFQDIPREEVPFDYSSLENYDMLENESKQHLLYYKNEQMYRFVNNDVDQFISDEQMLGYYIDTPLESLFVMKDFPKSPWHKL